jgi:F0F1-type ATP synthase membrane subunit c/vacuolar-type H+-ATPase subunit K
LLVYFIAFNVVNSFIFAQVTSSGTAVSTPITDSEAQDGDIICTYSEGNVRCNLEYDPSILGVISDNPAVSIEDFELESSRLVLTSGVATVRVSSVNGNIVEGDLISTSLKPGLGQKASRNGYVIGMAMEDYSSDNPDAVGRIQIVINIHPASGLSGPRGNLLQFIRQGLAVPVFEPIESLRYILAALMVIISFTLGMIYFGRASRTGIEAVGRNPLAKRVIQITIFTNIVLTIVIVMVGLAIAYLILVF